ncbi:LysR family glycine cleavage system transcriptional activator [Litoreibacter ponti]|uniref:LysR family glycine cleavage system transcriptional activator n=1 Tax=Litoreibacter ponti TaxID=1510457 RepID=A0A2T6BPW9_9RHOB|nr:LysR family transcriptional regulator [Litoreibacter ponti]PTX58111.1 LysR family glycine cleavage system transcriptional activator [Litoreibacter ponti]
MKWSELPSLAALRAFEATARLNGFSAAARELNVTHAAIAQHVRALEADLGVSLVFRSGAGMALTEQGRGLAASLGDGFRQIADGVALVRARKEDQPLNISLTPSFAENWLMPRIGAFWAEHPEIKVALNPSMDLVDLRRDGFDMSIRYGRGDWPGVDAEMLVHANFVIVGTPEMAEHVQGRNVLALGELPWVFETGREELIVWAQSVGLGECALDSIEVPTNSMAMSATRAGARISIQNKAVVERDLAEGRLVCLHEEAPSRLGYYLVRPPGIRSNRLKIFERWLKSVAKG